MRTKKRKSKKIILLFVSLVALIIVYLVWGNSSALKIASKTDKQVSTIENVIIQTVNKLPQSDAGFVAGYKATKFDLQLL